METGANSNISHSPVSKIEVLFTFPSQQWIMLGLHSYIECMLLLLNTKY